MTLAGWMVYALAVSVLVALAAWLLEGGVGRLGLPTRWIWAGALALGAILPLVAARGARDSAAAAAAPLDVAAQSLVVLPTEAIPLPDVEGSAASPFAFLAGWRATADRVLASVATPLARTTEGGGVWLAVLWVTASLVLALTTLAGTARLGRDLRGWPRRVLGGREVRVAPDLGPATVGLLRPRVVMPGWVLALPEDELELILAHEEEHVRTRDPLLLGLGLAAVVAFPWNPALWWQHRRLRDAVEVDCDRRVLARGAARARYGDVLVRMGIRRARRLTLAPTIHGSKSLLERRLAAMRTTRLRAALPRALATTALSVMLVAVACSTEVPVASDGIAGADAAAGVVERNQRVADVWVDADGSVHVNDVPQRIELMADAIRALDAAVDERIFVSITAHPSAPYRVVEDVQREVQASLPDRAFVAFSVDAVRPAPTPPGEPAEVMDGLRLVLPQMGEEVRVSSRNLLHLIVQPSGLVGVRRGESVQTHELSASEIEWLWRREVASAPNLIAAVKVHPDADYAHMVAVLDALHAADAERISIQELQLPEAEARVPTHTLVSPPG